MRNFNQHAETMPNTNIRAQVRAIRELTQLFLWERIVYLLASVASITLFFTVTIISIYTGELTAPSRFILIGNTGVFGLFIGRVLSMWNKAIDVIAPDLTRSRKNIVSRIWAWVSDKLLPDEM